MGAPDAPGEQAWAGSVSARADRIRNPRSARRRNSGWRVSRPAHRAKDRSRNGRDRRARFTRARSCAAGCAPMIRRLALLIGSLWLSLTARKPVPSETELDLFDDRLWWREVE